MVAQRFFLYAAWGKLDLHIKAPVERLSRFPAFEDLKIHDKVIRLSTPKNLTVMYKQGAETLFAPSQNVRYIHDNTTPVLSYKNDGGKQLTETAFNFKARRV